MIRAALLCLLLAGAAHAQDHVPAPGHAPGGTLRLVSSAGAGTIDPQINYTSQYGQIFAVVYDGLLGFRRVPGAAGLDLVGDLADAVPAPSDDGLLYRFHLRPGLRFSDGSTVRPSDAAASFRRIFRVASPTAGSFYAGIEGAADCLRDPASCTLPGVVADDAAGTLAIRLTRRDSDFLLKVAFQHASIVPASTPDQDAGTVPLLGTGPYRIAQYDPATGMRLERNPFFQVWSTDAQPPGVPDAIDYHFGLEGEAEVTQVENGQADWMFENPPPPDRQGELGADYASQVHLNPQIGIWFMPMNMHEPPFDDLRVRRAVNMAIDRAAVVKLFGGPRLAVPSCQVLPPELPGYVPYCPFPHDMAAAQALVRDSGTAGMKVTLVIDNSDLQRTLGTYVLSVLSDLGYDARLRVLSATLQFPYIQNTLNHVQISITTWYDDYPGATDFLPTLFSCGAFHAGSDASVNFSGLCDPALDARMQAAADTGDPAAWAAVDREVTDLAAFAVLLNPRYVDLTSRRVENFIYHEQYHWLLGQAQVR